MPNMGFCMGAKGKYLLPFQPNPEVNGILSAQFLGCFNDFYSERELPDSFGISAQELVPASFLDQSVDNECPFFPNYQLFDSERWCFTWRYFGALLQLEQFWGKYKNQYGR